MLLLRYVMVCIPLDLAEATAAHDERLEIELPHRLAHLLPGVTPVHLHHHAQLIRSFMYDDEAQTASPRSFNGKRKGRRQQ